MALPSNIRGQIQALFAEAERASSSVFSGNRQSGSGSLEGATTNSALSLLMNPPLPALLAPLPGLFRLAAFLIVAPVLFVTLVDFAGYAVFRTLGFRRRRVRVKQPLVRKRSEPRPETSVSQQAFSPLPPPHHAGHPSSPGAAGPAPLLSPGAYDAEELLRHRARSVSMDSQAEAAEEWTRTGGNFARVSTVRAREAAAVAAAAAAAKQAGTGPAGFERGPEGQSGPITPADDRSSTVSPPDSPRSLFARAKGVGVEGALGYFDTDAEDSGAESGSNSPVITRGTGRRGLKSDKFTFTPMAERTTHSTFKDHQQQAASPTALSSNIDNPNMLNVSLTGATAGAEESSRGSGATSPYSFIGGSSERSPTFGADSNSSWVGVEATSSMETDPLTAAAADLEPFQVANKDAGHS